MYPEEVGHAESFVETPDAAEFADGPCTPPVEFADVEALAFVADGPEFAEVDEVPVPVAAEVFPDDDVGFAGAADALEKTPI